MLLQGPDNTEFELKVVGYEFPGIKDTVYDSDWLKIAIRVKIPRGPWTSTNAYLLTWEVARLADWFCSIADRTPADSAMDFIEPNLRFELLPDAKAQILRVYFELEARPPWARSTVAGLDDLWADLYASPGGVKNAAASLRADLQRFPPRVDTRL